MKVHDFKKDSDTMRLNEERSRSQKKKLQAKHTVVKNDDATTAKATTRRKKTETEAV